MCFGSGEIFWGERTVEEKEVADVYKRQGRNITGIKSENSMKRIFWKLRDAGMLYMIGAGSAAAWKKTDDFESKAKTLKVNKNKED